MGRNHPIFAGARFRGVALIALVAVPLLALTTYSNARQRADAREDAQARALNIAILAQHEYQNRLDAAQQLLTPALPIRGADVIAQVKANPAACNRVMADLLGRRPEYLNLFQVDREGDLICSGTPSTGRVNVADRDYFIAVMRTGRPAAGDLTIGRVSGKPAVIVANPILDEAGAVVGLAAASLDLSNIVQLPEALDLPPGSTVTMLDGAGTIMARNMDPKGWVGKPGPEIAGLGSSVMAKNGTTVGTGVDGVARLYGVVALRPGDGPTHGTLLVGIPTRTAYGKADAAFAENLTWLAAVCAFATAAAWIGATRLVINPLRAISVAVQRIAAGDFRTRTGLADRRGEVGMLATAVDRMAEQLTASLAEQERDRQEMATLLSTAPSVIVVANRDGTVTRINRTVDTHFGWPAEEFVGRDLNMLFDAPVIPTAGRIEAPHIVERLGLRRNGDTFPAEVDIREVEGSSGARYVVIVRNLTERRRMEAEREMGRLAVARAEFLRTLSHELRSPLTAVVGFAQLIAADATGDRMRRQAQDIEDAGRHMLALVNDLLDLARIDAGHWEVNLAEVDVTHLLSGVAEGLRARATERGLGLGVYTSPEPAIAVTDARILREIATNLIENAIKYTDAGAVAVRATIAKDTLELEVVDTGIGIPPDRLESVFDEFEQVTPTGAEHGAGLGLAITRKLVALLGGTIGVVSTPGTGSVFTVRLPLNAAGASVGGSAMTRPA